MISFATALGASLWTFPFIGIYLVIRKVLADPYLLILLRQGMILAIPCLSGYFGYIASKSPIASISVAGLWLGIYLLIIKKRKS
jgi:hypothetical protein